MLRSDWRIIFAAVGFLAVVSAAGLMAFLYPQKIPIRRDSAAETVFADHQGTDSKCNPTVLHHLTGPERSSQTDACADSARKKQEERNNYIQSARSADAAEASAIYAFDQARVAAIGGALGFITMVAALLAAVYAAAAAHYTQESVRVAGNQLKAIRAKVNLYPSNPTLENIVTRARNAPNFSPEIPIINLQFQNSGNSAAHIVEIRANHLFDFNIPDQPPFNKTQVVSFLDQTIFQNDTSENRQLPLSGGVLNLGQIHQIIGGSIFAFFYGIIIYTDFLGEMHETAWCMRSGTDGKYGYWGGIKYNYST